MKTPDMTVSFVQKKQSASQPREASGLLRELLSVEWKLFRRNRCTRWMLVFFGFVLLVGSGYALGDYYYGYFFMFYFMIPGIYTSFTLTCLSTFYDGLMSRPVLEIRIARNIVYTHHISTLLYFGTLMVLSGIIQRNPNNIFMIGSAFLYVLGICNYILAFAATSIESVARMELNVKFSDVGYGYPYRETVASNNVFRNRWIMPIFWLMVILIMPGLAAVLSFLPATHGILFPIMSILGLVGLLFHGRWLRLIASSLEKRRYELLERFRGG